MLYSKISAVWSGGHEEVERFGAVQRCVAAERGCRIFDKTRFLDAPTPTFACTQSGHWTGDGNNLIARVRAVSLA